MKAMISKMKKYLPVAVLALVAGFGGATISKLTSPQTNYYSQSYVQPTRLTGFAPTPPETGIDFTRAADLTLHSVVHVNTFYEQHNVNTYFNDPFGGFYGGRGLHSNPEPAEASGSGVIISEDGYIATNNHVIDNADKVQITLNDKRQFIAKVVGRDPSTDLALLKIEEKGLPYISYGNSDDVRVGEWVLAVGNPFNLTSTVTAGIVSAKGRNLDILSNKYKIESFIQTDAAVNPGNSGGALVNTRGELIGINAAIASNTGSYTGYAFAIPVTIVKKVMADLLEFGQVQRAILGVNIKDIDSKLATEKGIKEMKGIYVDAINDGSSAEAAGMKEGDIITRVGAQDVNSAAELQEQVSRFRPGDKVDVTYLRNGESKTVNVTLKNKNGNTNVVKKDAKEIVSLLGSEFENVSADDMDKLKLTGGVKIKSLSPGKLRSAGIREGFIITSIDKKPITDTDDLMNALQNKSGGVLIEGIYTNGMRAYYGFGL